MSSAIPGGTYNVVTLRDLLRVDLGDPAGTGAVLSDAELERAVVRAVREYSLAWPRAMLTTLTATAGSRELSFATLTDLIRIDAVEWPVDLYPRAYIGWSTSGGTTLELLVETAPSASQLSVAVYWGAVHQCDAAGLTVDVKHHDLVLIGAAGYAQLALGTETVNRVNLTAAAAVGYARAAAASLDHFHAELVRTRRRGAIRPATLFVADTPVRSESTDPGPQ